MVANPLNPTNPLDENEFLFFLNIVQIISSLVSIHSRPMKVLVLEVLLFSIVLLFFQLPLYTLLTHVNKCNTLPKQFRNTF